MWFSCSLPFDNEDVAKIKRCPMCHIPIERDEGCAQMMCKRCKHVFCWYCLANLDVSLFLDSKSCQKLILYSKSGWNINILDECIFFVLNLDVSLIFTLSLAESLFLTLNYWCFTFANVFYIVLHPLFCGFILFTFQGCLDSCIYFLMLKNIYCSVLVKSILDMCEFAILSWLFQNNVHRINT